MNLIDNNPYRILGLPITASEKEIARQISTLSTHAKTFGKTKSLDTDFPFLSTINRNPSEIEEAKKQIEKSENKLLYSLFWFWKNNSVDELTLEVLKEGNTNKAIEICEKSVFANKINVYKPIVFIENLIKSSTDWSTKNSENHLLTLKDDEYIIERKAETSSSIPVVYAEINDDENWTIECDTEWHNGVDDIGYGIIIGRDGENYFSFDLAGNGYYCFGKDTESTYEKLISWKKCDAINKWSKNHVQIEKINDRLNFYINLEFVDSIQYQKLVGKYFGFKVTKNQKISFRNFKFCKLVEDETYGEGINVTLKNFSNLKNLSTLYLSMATYNGTFQIDNFKKGIVLAKTFFTAENFDDFSKLIAGERYIYKPDKVLHFYVNEVIDSLKNYIEKPNGISTSQLINTFSSFPVEAKHFLNKRFVSKQIHNIEKEIEIAKTERNKSASTAHETGKKLISNTKSDIAYLKNVLGESDYEYQIIADKLSLAIVQCGIDHYIATKNDEVYLHEYEFALSIAVTERTRERAKENLDSCKEWIKNKHLYICWFCGNKQPEESSEFSITIYKETSRMPTVKGTSIKYSYVPINIQRCSACKKVHSQSSNNFYFALIGCAVTGLIIGANQSKEDSWFFGLLIGGLLGWMFGAILKFEQISKAKIKDTKESTIKNYPVLDQMLKDGWSFSKPQA